LHNEIYFNENIRVDIGVVWLKDVMIFLIRNMPYYKMMDNYKLIDDNNDRKLKRLNIDLGSGDIVQRVLSINPYK
jgi:hypothetical protein